MTPEVEEEDDWQLPVHFIEDEEDTLSEENAPVEDVTPEEAPDAADESASEEYWDVSSDVSSDMTSDVTTEIEPDVSSDENPTQETVETLSTYQAQPVIDIYEKKKAA